MSLWPRTLFPLIPLDDLPDGKPDADADALPAPRQSPPSTSMLPIPARIPAVPPWLSMLARELGRDLIGEGAADADPEAELEACLSCGLTKKGLVLYPMGSPVSSVR